MHVKRLLLVVVVAAIASGAAAPSAKRAAVVPKGVTIGGVHVGNLPIEQARAAISWWYNRPLHFVFYGKRWSIECGLRDTKDLRFGMAMGTVHVSTPERRDRLWLLNALAVALLTLLPAALHLSRQAMRADPKDGELALKLFRSNRWCGLLVFLAMLVVGFSAR